MYMLTLTVIRRRMEELEGPQRKVKTKLAFLEALEQLDEGILEALREIQGICREQSLRGRESGEDPKGWRRRTTEFLRLSEGLTDLVKESSL